VSKSIPRIGILVMKDILFLYPIAELQTMLMLVSSISLVSMYVLFRLRLYNYTGSSDDPRLVARVVLTLAPWALGQHIGMILAIVVPLKEPRQA
jgi:hypothetical protein